MNPVLKFQISSDNAVRLPSPSCLWYILLVNTYIFGIYFWYFSQSSNLRMFITSLSSTENMTPTTPTTSTNTKPPRPRTRARKITEIVARFSLQTMCKLHDHKLQLHDHKAPVHTNFFSFSPKFTNSNARFKTLFGANTEFKKTQKHFLLSKKKQQGEP